MITKIATGLFAFAAMFAMFEGSATATDLELGKKTAFTNNGANIQVVFERKDDMKEGVYYVKLVEGGSQGFREDGKWGYLTAESANSGAFVITNGKSAKTKWRMVEKGGTWSFVYADDKSLSLIHVPGGLKLGVTKDSKDQLWVKE